jgi:trimethylamine--corrinoid protein Co-methyltransferase
MKLSSPIRFLSPDEMQTVHRNALRILAEIGMQIDHDDALDYLESAGCRIDRVKRIARFPEDVVQKFVNKMRADFAARKFPERMAVRYSHVRFRKEEFKIHHDFTVSSGGYCVFIYDLDGVRRPATLQDTRDALKLAAQLDQVTYTGLPVAAQDVPLPIRPVTMAAELVKHTTKLGGIEALTTFDVEYICRIGEVVRGGPEELRKAPVLIGYAEARTPLVIDRNMCEIMIEYIKRGMPQSLDTMPNAGATAPINPAAALALGIAETLGGIVLAYSVDPNACVTIDVTPSFSDMGTGIFKYAGAERISLLGARIQMISEFYCCPSGVHGGKTDTCVPDVRCGVEKGISMLMPVLCGAVGFGTIGHLENAVTFSPAQLVMDNEIARYVRRAVTGFAVTDDAVNFDLIKKVGIGGNFLQEDDTLAQFRDFLNLSPFFKVEPWGSSPSADECRRWETMANVRANELIANDIESPLTRDQEKEIDAIVAEATAKLKQSGQL